MKRPPFFPMSVKAFVISMFSGLLLVFLAVFLLTPSSVKYAYDKTVRVEVLNIFRSASSTKPANRFDKKMKLQIRYEDGMSQVISLPFTGKVKTGDVINLDVYQADGEKPRYRLAQDPIAP